MGIQKFERSKWRDVCAAVSIALLGKRAEIEVVDHFVFQPREMYLDSGSVECNRDAARQSGAGRAVILRVRLQDFKIHNVRISTHALDLILAMVVGGGPHEVDRGGRVVALHPNDFV